jgi:exopolysaccharide biosynthesis protein
VNSFDYAVYNTDIRRWVNLPALVTQNGLVTFTDGRPTFYRRAHVFSRARLSLAPVSAGLSMYPLLLEDGEVIDSSAEQSDVQKLRSMKGSIGSDGTHLFLALIANVTVTGSAQVLQALGVRDALNLDGGGTSAMWFDGAYRVGPGRLLPNAVVRTRR